MSLSRPNLAQEGDDVRLRGKPREGEYRAQISRLIVLSDDFNLFAEYAAGLVDPIEPDLRARERVFAGIRAWAGDGQHHADLNRVAGCARDARERGTGKARVIGYENVVYSGPRTVSEPAGIDDGHADKLGADADEIGAHHERSTCGHCRQGSLVESCFVPQISVNFAHIVFCNGGRLFRRQDAAEIGMPFQGRAEPAPDVGRHRRAVTGTALKRVKDGGGDGDLLHALASASLMSQAGISS
jgi:hypothetical protein